MNNKPHRRQRPTPLFMRRIYAKRYAALEATPWSYVRSVTLYDWALNDAEMLAASRGDLSGGVELQPPIP